MHSGTLWSILAQINARVSISRQYDMTLWDHHLAHGKSVTESCCGVHDCTVSMSFGDVYTQNMACGMVQVLL
jgi:hypothetical protein